MPQTNRLMKTGPCGLQNFEETSIHGSETSFFQGTWDLRPAKFRRSSNRRSETGFFQGTWDLRPAKFRRSSNRRSETGFFQGTWDLRPAKFRRMFHSGTFFIFLTHRFWDLAKVPGEAQLTVSGAYV